MLPPWIAGDESVWKIGKMLVSELGFSRITSVWVTFRAFLGVMWHFTFSRFLAKELCGLENPFKGMVVQLSVRSVISFKTTRSLNRTRACALGLNNHRSNLVCVVPFLILLKSSFKLGFFFLPFSLSCFFVAFRLEGFLKLGYLAGDAYPVSMWLSGQNSTVGLTKWGWSGRMGGMTFGC